MHSSLWLGLLLIVPLVAAALITMTRASSARARGIGITAAVVELIVAVGVTLAYRAQHVVTLGHTSTYDFVLRKSLAPSWGLSFDLGLDGISVFLVLLTAIVVLLALLGANEAKRTPSSYRGCSS